MASVHEEIPERAGTSCSSPAARSTRCTSPSCPDTPGRPVPRACPRPSSPSSSATGRGGSSPQIADAAARAPGRGQDVTGRFQTAPGRRPVVSTRDGDRSTRLLVQPVIYDFPHGMKGCHAPEVLGGGGRPPLVCTVPAKRQTGHRRLTHTSPLSPPRATGASGERDLAAGPGRVHHRPARRARPRVAARSGRRRTRTRPQQRGPARHGRGRSAHRAPRNRSPDRRRPGPHRAAGTPHPPPVTQPDSRVRPA